MIALQGWREWEARSVQVRTSGTALVNLATSLAQQAEGMIDNAGTAVTATVKQLEVNGTSPTARAHLEQILRAQRPGFSGFRDIIVSDENGQHLATSLTFPGDVSNREYFRRQRDEPDTGLLLSHPIQSAKSGRWVITVSRRFNGPDGSFAGIVFAVIDLSSFVDSYKTYDLGPNGTLGITMTDGTVLARYPSHDDMIGKDVSKKAQVFRQLREHPSGSFANNGFIDGIPRFDGYHVSDRYPFVVVAAMSQDEALSAWQTDMRSHMLIATVLAAVIAMLGLYLIRQTRRSQAAEQRVRENEAHQRVLAEKYRLSEQRHRLLINGAADYAICWLDPAGHIDTWSTGGQELQGYTATEIVGKHFSVLMTQQDLAAGLPQRMLQEAVQKGKFSGEGWRVRKDGSRLWGTVLLQPVHGPRNSLIGFAQIFHDETARREVEQERNNALKELQAVLNTMGDGLLIIDETGVILTFTPVAEHIFGYRDQEVLGKNISILVPDLDLSLQDGAFEDSPLTDVKQAVGNRKEVEAQHQNGNRFSMELGISSYKMGDLHRFVAIVRDVTEAKHIQETLRARDESLQLAWRGTGIGMWDWNIVTGELYFSDRFKEVLGFAPNELPPRFDEWDQRLHPDDRAATYEVLDAHLTSGAPYAMDYRMRTKSGEWRWFNACGQAAWDAAGKPVRMAGSIADITESRGQRQALQTSEEIFRSAMQAAAIGMALVAPSGRWLLVNPALCELLGYEDSELLQTDFQATIFDADRDESLEKIDRMLSGDTTPYNAELRFTHRSGRIIWMNLSASCVLDSAGTCDYFVWQLQDVTERKRMSIMQDEFVSTVNHELRTPLSSIYGSLRLLKARNAGQLDDKGARLLDLADQSCTRLSALVNDILDLEKIAAGKIAYVMERLEINELVRDIVERHSGLAERHEVVFKTTIHPDQVAVIVDPARFNQALVNLLSNAAKYSQKGDTVSIEVKPAEAGQVRVSVTDHGSGIPEAFRHKVFERFAQADSSATRKVGGSGLGLNITKSIIQTFGGEVSFESVEGEGTTFHFDLPICTAEAKAA